MNVNERGISLRFREKSLAKGYRMSHSESALQGCPAEKKPADCPQRGSFMILHGAFSAATMRKSRQLRAF